MNKKRKLALFIAVLLIVTGWSSTMFSVGALPAEPKHNIKVQSVPVVTHMKGPIKTEPLLFTSITDSYFYSANIGKAKLDEVSSSIEQLAVEVLYGNYTSKALEIMRQESTRLIEVKLRLIKRLNKIATWEKDYYYATKTWSYLMEQGFSEEVTAGIIGNMMIETIGMSLDLKPYVYGLDNNYFGLCQWAIIYYPDVEQLTFEAQLDFLKLDLPEQFDIFGWLYAPDFTYEDFKALTDPKESALAFATTYERCGAGSYELRQQAAIKAYNYFKFN